MKKNDDDLPPKITRGGRDKQPQAVFRWSSHPLPSCTSTLLLCSSACLFYREDLLGKSAQKRETRRPEDARWRCPAGSRRRPARGEEMTKKRRRRRDDEKKSGEEEKDARLLRRQTSRSSPSVHLSHTRRETPRIKDSAVALQPRPSSTNFALAEPAALAFQAKNRLISANSAQLIHSPFVRRLRFLWKLRSLLAGLCTGQRQTLSHLCLPPEVVEQTAGVSTGSRKRLRTCAHRETPKRRWWRY